MKTANPYNTPKTKAIEAQVKALQDHIIEEYAKIADDPFVQQCFRGEIQKTLYGLGGGFYTKMTMEELQEARS
jgi:hypothetical protein